MHATPANVPGRDRLSSSMISLLAFACGIIGANIYYAQPLVGPISAELGLSAGAAGFIVTMTQIGYGLGLLFIVPLGDLVENRRLILCVMGVAILALISASLSASAVQFLVSALLIGMGSVALQVIVPFSARLASPEVRGQVVGKVMAGLMIGIMMARPVSSMVTYISHWQAVFALSSVAMIALAFTLWQKLPAHAPKVQVTYVSLLASLWHLVVTTPVLRRRALYQACLFAAFSLFWTTTPLVLAGPDFGLSQIGIALFALAGVGGAVGAPVAGYMADRGMSHLATAISMVAVAVGFLITHIAPVGSWVSLAMFVVAAILVDLGAQGNVVTGQRALFMLNPAYHSRFNGIYIASFFAAGAFGSALGGWLYALGGWWLASWAGVAFPLVALACFSREWRFRPGSVST